MRGVEVAAAAAGTAVVAAHVGVGSDIMSVLRVEWSCTQGGLSGSRTVRYARGTKNNSEGGRGVGEERGGVQKECETSENG